MAPASTGSASSSSIVVSRTLHAKSGICSKFIVFGFMFRIVMMKFSELIIDDAPAKCRDRIVMSTDIPE